MPPFHTQIRQHLPTPAEAASRHWIYIPYDRLHQNVGPLADTVPEETILVFMESRAKGTRRPYHKKKLTLVLSAMRHFALEQAQRGAKVVYGTSLTSFTDGLLDLQQQWSWPELLTNRPAERELRIELEAATDLRLTFLPDTAWISTADDFETVFGKPRPREKPTQRQYLMDRFYRAVRHNTSLLMENGKPVGGKYSFDAENRQPWRNDIPVPIRPTFPPDAITLEVMDYVATHFPDNFGQLAGFDLPVTRADAERAWDFALTNLLPWFGPWEDAMSTAHPDLFHSMTSPLLNLTLLRPIDVVTQVADAHAAGKIPLASAEGFIRQIIGWREFIRHIHDATDGFRTLEPNGAPSHLDAHRPLPAVYWGTPSGLRCMDHTVAQVVQTGWSHHITRLMVLSNLATLCGFSPRQLTDWFWFAYIDAYDWVVEPNVLGMSTFADGGLTATKPYVSGAAYINKMSDFCGKCALNPKLTLGPGSCPFTALYWSFLERNEAKLAPLNRMAMPLTTMRKKPAAERTALRERAEAALAQLEAGQIVT
jgi:deoxyribodipyrimidine photolyase-related protein